MTGQIRPATESPYAGRATATEASSPVRDRATEMVGKDAFLRLLVAQIKNQNPLDPADGVQFLTQLAQFSELEQLIQIRQGLETLAARSESAASAVDNSSGAA